MEIHNRFILTKSEFIYLFTLLGGTELPDDILNSEEVMKCSEELTISRNNLERKGVLSIGFDGIARVNAELKRCTTTFINRDNYYVMKWNNRDNTEESVYFFIFGEDYCEMSQAMNGESFELTLITDIHVLASSIIEKFVNLILSENDFLRSVWIGHFEQINDGWKAEKQFFTGSQEQNLWISDITQEAGEQITSTTLTEILDNLDLWLSDLYGMSGG